MQSVIWFHRHLIAITNNSVPNLKKCFLEYVGINMNVQMSYCAMDYKSVDCYCYACTNLSNWNQNQPTRCFVRLIAPVHKTVISNVSWIFSSSQIVILTVIKTSLAKEKKKQFLTHHPNKDYNNANSTIENHLTSLSCSTWMIWHLIHKVVWSKMCSVFCCATDIVNTGNTLLLDANCFVIHCYSGWLFVF